MGRLIAFAIFICIACGCQPEIRKEIYLIPDGFIGNVIVVYDHDDGIADSIVNNDVIYKIPKSGVLYLKEGMHLLDHARMRYYYYDDMGNKTKICWIDSAKANCNAIVYNNQAAGFGISERNEDQYNYSVIAIGTKDSIPATFDPYNFSFKNKKLQLSSQQGLSKRTLR